MGAWTAGCPGAGTRRRREHSGRAPHDHCHLGDPHVHRTTLLRTVAVLTLLTTAACAGDDDDDAATDDTTSATVTATDAVAGTTSAPPAAETTESGGRRCDDAIDSGDDRRPGHDRGRQQRRVRVHADPGRAPRRRRGRTRPGRRPRLRHRCRLGQPVGAVQDEHRDAGLHHDGLGVGPAVHGDRGRRHRTDARRVVGAQRRLHRVDVPHPRRRQVPRRHAARRRGGRVQPRVLPVRPAHRRRLPAVQGGDVVGPGRDDHDERAGRRAAPADDRAAVRLHVLTDVDEDAARRPAAHRGLADLRPRGRGRAGHW